MSTTARKQRKRDRIPFTKPTKTPTRPYASGKPEGWGFVTGAEILASMYLTRTRT